MNLRRRILGTYNRCLRRSSDALNISKDALRKIFSAAISSLVMNSIFLPLLTTALFVSYMANYDFFSYDFFSEGLFGMKLFILSMVATTVLTSFALFGSALPIYAKFKGKEVSKASIVVPLIINIVFIVIIGVVVVGTGNYEFPVFMVFLSGFIIVHFGVSIFGNFKQKVVFIGALFGLSFTIVFGQPEYSAKLLGNGLRAFGIGGEIPVELTTEKDRKREVKLLLVSPQNFYFLNESNKTSVISLGNVVEYSKT